jgi:hypothetical protein
LNTLPGVLSDFEAPREFAALKICNCDILDSERWSEAHMHMHLAEANPGYPGYAVLGLSFEAFDIRSPRGDDHLVLAFEPLREPLWLFRRRISTKQSAPMVRRLRLIKIYVKILLEGLDYMHSQCKVVHTGKTTHYGVLFPFSGKLLSCSTMHLFCVAPSKA